MTLDVGIQSQICSSRSNVGHPCSELFASIVVDWNLDVGIQSQSSRRSNVACRCSESFASIVVELAMQYNTPF
jgi:hypothetical protein